MTNYYISGFHYDSGSKVSTFLGFATILVQKLLRFWVLLQFWFKSFYISGYYYNSGSKVTTFLVLLHFWLFTTFLGLTNVSNKKTSSCIVYLTVGEILDFCSFHISLSNAFGDNFFFFQIETYMMWVNVFYAGRNEISVESNKKMRNFPINPHRL